MVKGLKWMRTCPLSQLREWQSYSGSTNVFLDVFLGFMPSIYHVTRLTISSCTNLHEYNSRWPECSRRYKSEKLNFPLAVPTNSIGLAVHMDRHQQSILVCLNLVGLRKTLSTAINRIPYVCHDVKSCCVISKEDNANLSKAIRFSTLMKRVPRIKIIMFIIQGVFFIVSSLWSSLLPSFLIRFCSSTPHFHREMRRNRMKYRS